VGDVSLWIGHNVINYDFVVLAGLLGIQLTSYARQCVDTLIASKLIHYSRPDGHSIEAYGQAFGEEKIKFEDFSKWSKKLEEYCIRDVDICHKIYNQYSEWINDPTQRGPLGMEQEFQWLVVNKLHANGFCFNVTEAKRHLAFVTKELEKLDKEILNVFPPREVLIREFTPKATKYQTISKTSVPRSLWENIADYEIGRTYRHTKTVEFNPASPKQIIEVLADAKWQPEVKTKAHLEWLRRMSVLKRSGKASLELAERIKECYDALVKLEKYGWKINEVNLSTLPPDAPAPARTLARRILYEARRRTLTEWLNLVRPDGRIHGDFIGIGAWTHRMSHQKPNMANIPNSHDLNGNVKLLGKEMRALWKAPRNRLLVGVDAEGIQLRIFAHLIDDAEFTRALVEGKKEDKSDPHSLNQRILGAVCRTRAAAKRFIFALLLGGGLGKLGEILDASKNETESALARLMDRYQGFTDLKKRVIPADAERGWFVGIDGRRVAIPGESAGKRAHLAMSGYLQNGEAIVMKMAAILWSRQLPEALIVDMVHDEWQTECRNSMDVALRIAKIQADSLRIVGEQLKLRCPLAGSYYNDDIRDYTIGTNWASTH
jgi:DNA polymerase I - 3''-5'' exonuclease and polymerase domains